MTAVSPFRNSMFSSGVGVVWYSRTPRGMLTPLRFVLICQPEMATEALPAFCLSVTELGINVGFVLLFVFTALTVTFCQYGERSAVVKPAGMSLEPENREKRLPKKPLDAGGAGGVVPVWSAPCV